MWADDLRPDDVLREIDWVAEDVRQWIAERAGLASLGALPASRGTDERVRQVVVSAILDGIHARRIVRRPHDGQIVLVTHDG